MTPEEEVRRGAEAKQALALLREAFDTIARRLTDLSDQVETTPEKAEYLRTIRIGCKKAEKYLEQIVVGGKMAAMELEKQQSFTERMAQRAKRFVA